MLALATIAILQAADPVLEALGKRAQSGDFKGAAITLTDGSTGYLVTGQTAVVLHELRKIKWEELAPECVRKLVGGDSADMMKYLMKRDRVDEVRAVLETWGPERRAEIEEILCEGMAPPDGGWSWDKQLGFIPGGKKHLIAWKKALVAAERIKQGKEPGELKEEPGIEPYVTKLLERARKKPPAPPDRAALAKAREALAKARKEALRHIAAESFPQAKIDAEVARLRELFAGPFGRELRLVGADAREQAVIDFNERVTAYNAAAKISDDGRAQITLLNNYRHMLGHKMLFFDERLERAAEKHAAHMEKAQMIWHDNGADTMRKRVEAEGWNGRIGENVCMGADDAARAHDLWYHSPGHHRGMIAEHYTGIGVGRSGAFWCQNFGDMAPPAAVGP